MSDLVKIEEVQHVANELKKFVVKNELYTSIQGKNFVHVEGWQFAGASMGMRAVVEQVDNLNPMGDGDEVKYSCTVKLYRGDEIAGSGVGFCSNKEKSKKYFDEYAIIAMAQTRAISRAYRNSIGWIMKLAGYETTPYEQTIIDVDAAPEKKAAIVDAHKNI